jgi:hypothetical protein
MKPLPRRILERSSTHGEPAKSGIRRSGSHAFRGQHLFGHFVGQGKKDRRDFDPKALTVFLTVS